MRRVAFLVVALLLGYPAGAQTSAVGFGGDTYVKKFEGSKSAPDIFVEFGLAPEPIEKWSKLFVFHSQPQSGNDPLRAATNLAKTVKAHNKDARFRIIENKTSREAIIDFLTSAPNSDIMEFNVFKFTRAVDGKGLVAAQFAFRFTLGEVDGNELSKIRQRAVADMARFDMAAVKDHFAKSR
jgi:hypothetical protein